MTVLAVISDTHLPRGTRRLPEACVERCRSADRILHAGDLSSLATLRALEAIGPPVSAVHGNVDEADVVARLPGERRLGVEEVVIAMVHNGGPARGRLERLSRRFPGADVVVFGHSHIPLHERAGDFHIFNPGSPTDRRRQPRHTMGLIHVSGASVELELIALDAPGR